MEEKRRFVRIDWPVVVQYKTLEEPITKDQTLGRDISENGISFVVYERLPKGTRLDIQIQTPFDSLPIFVKGKVSWIRALGEESKKTFEVGVEFIEIDQKDQRRLREYIDTQIKQKRL